MITLTKFRIFVDKLNKDNSRKYKMSVLEEYKDDEVIKYYLNFVFNSYITTGISDKKLSKINYYKDLSFTFESVKDLLEHIRVNNTGKDDILCEIFNFMHDAQDVYEEEVDLLKAIITKNLPIGIDAKTINKVIPNLIPEFNVMLANKYFDNPDIVEGKEFALTTKIDGGRIIAIKKDNKVSFYTRAGQLYEGLVDLEKEMMSYMPNNIALDGEITLLDKGALSSKEQYQQTMMITRRLGEKHGIKMLVFDAMLADGFLNQKYAPTYKERRDALEIIFEESPLKYFDLLPILYTGTDTSEINKWLNYSLKNGEEGIMINMLDASYEFKRTNSLLKVKKMNDVDLTVVGFEEGRNKHSGSLGALLVNYKDNVVKVGSGLSDGLRKEIWSNQSEWLDRTIVVQYFEETTNQQGGISLRFPVYVDYRTDK